jgi:hypothetical protein
MHAMLMGAAMLALAGPVSQDSVPLYDNLGEHHYRITTAEPIAQRYFDQGLRLYYAFNHAEAIRAFEEGARRDPSCAMCWWGVAVSLGPNINLPMDPSWSRWPSRRSGKPRPGPATSPRWSEPSSRPRPGGTGTRRGLIGPPGIRPMRVRSARWSGTTRPTWRQRPCSQSPHDPAAVVVLDPKG